MTATATATGLKAIITTDVFHAALSTARKVIKANSPSPILQCVRITASDGEVRLFTTNNEASVIADIDAVDVHIEGEAMIPCHKLHQIISRISDPTFTLEVDGKNHATISTSTATFKVYGYPPQDGPALPEPPAEYSHSMKADMFREWMMSAHVCSATQHGNYAITGVLIDLLKNGKARFVATDGRRLVVVGDRNTTPDSVVESAIVSRSVNLAAQSAGEDDVHIHIDRKMSHIWIHTSEATFIFQSIDGKFPPYFDVIPKSHTTTAKVDAKKWLDAVKSASVLTNEESKGVRFTWSNDGVSLSSRAPEMGEASILCEVESYEGEPLEIGFNPAFIADWLSALDGELSVRLTAHNKPMTVTHGTDRLFVIMPVNLK